MTTLKKSKGKRTRENILLDSRKILNETGVFLTLRELSKIIGITIGGITNYFPTKDHLFMGLAEVYEKELSAPEISESFKNDPSLYSMHTLLSNIMDIQFANRSTIRFISIASQSQKTLFEKVTETWNSRKERPIAMVEALVHKGFLLDSILDEFHLRVFRFQFINTLTTWISSYSLYDFDIPYNQMKPIYLAGMLNTFEPFLSPKGETQYREILKQLTENLEN